MKAPKLAMSRSKEPQYPQRNTWVDGSEGKGMRMESYRIISEELEAEMPGNPRQRSEGANKQHNGGTDPTM